MNTNVDKVRILPSISSISCLTVSKFMYITFIIAWRNRTDIFTKSSATTRTKLGLFGFVETAAEMRQNITPAYSAILKQLKGNFTPFCYENIFLISWNENEIVDW